MKYWTVQKRTIVESVLQRNDYYPDFSESLKNGAFEKDRIDADDISLSPLYERILNAYNKINHTNNSGLVFSFLSANDLGVKSINNFDEFFTQMQASQRYIYSMWNSFIKQDSLILELSFWEPFNDIRIGFNNYQFLMPPIIYIPPYTEEIKNKLYESIDTGVPVQDYQQSGLMQAHLPYIKLHNIINVYDMFELNPKYL